LGVCITKGGRVTRRGDPIAPSLIGSARQHTGPRKDDPVRRAGPMVRVHLEQGTQVRHKGHLVTVPAQKVMDVVQGALNIVGVRVHGVGHQ